METLKTEHEFKLPMGFVDETGTLHREGSMRLATAFDEIGPMKDPRVQQNPGYLSVILLSRVVTRLGALTSINPKVIEGLYSGDFAYLQGMYNRINENGRNVIASECPKCGHKFDVEADAPGEE